MASPALMNWSMIGLGDVDEVAELGFPEDERFGIVAAVAVFEAEDSGFGERRVVDFATSLTGCDVFQRHVFVFVLDVDEDGVALIEGAAAGVLSAEADVGTGFHQAREGESLGHAVIDRALACAHLGALFEKLLYFGVDVEAFGIGGQALSLVRTTLRRRVRFRLRIRAGRGRRNSYSSISEGRASGACA